MAATPQSIDDYIAAFPPPIQEALQQVRRAVREALPEGVEAISYQIPTFKLDGRNLVHFGAWTRHIGFYPLPTGDEDFERDLAPYRGGKGTARFPLGRPMPLALIRRIVELRQAEVQTGSR